MTRILSLAITVLTVACTSITPHENFKVHMAMDVGRRIDEPRSEIHADPDRLVASRELTNGNIENEYRWYRDCRYFFEYERQTLRIVSWRYQGSEDDCKINP
jgi:sarcosine oxidase delta subunit